MSHLFGGQPKVIPEFTGLQVQTSVQVLPIQIIYGGPRVAINLIYYNGFQSKLIKQGGGGGKGIISGGKGGGSQQVEYFATIILGIGEGDFGEIAIIYQDQQVWMPSNFPSNGADFFGGDTVSNANPWAFITANWPQDARTFPHTAYYGFSNAQLDSTATVPQIALVPKGILTGTSPLNDSTITISTGQYDSHGNPVSFIGDIHLGTIDADPAEVIIDYLTNDRYGATFPMRFLDLTTLRTSANGYNSGVGDAALSTFCQAVGLAWSVSIENAESANSRLDRWCKNMNVAPVWDGQLLGFFPYWDAFANGNPGWSASNGIAKKYFQPYLTPVVTIPLEQVLQSTSKEEDPITVSRKDPLEVYNTVRIDFKDRTNFFNNVPAEAKDEAHIERFGARIDNIGLASEYTLSAYANIAANMLLRRNVGILREFTWKMGPLWGWLTPMVVVAIPDPTNWTNNITVRITSVDEDEEEEITIVAEEFPAGSQAPSTMPLSPTTPPNQGPTNSPPSPVFFPVIFEPTDTMLTATGFAVPQIIAGFSGGTDGVLDGNWGGAFIWASLDGVNYELLGAMQGPSTIGTIHSDLPAYGGANPDMSDSIIVDLNQSDGKLVSFDPSAAALGTVSLCVLTDYSGFEVFAYTTATLVGDFTYNLTGLYRGLYGTPPRFWGAGSLLLFLGSGSNFFETPLSPAYVGVPIALKFQSFNVYHTAEQDLADCIAYLYEPTGSLPPLGPKAPIMQPADYRRRSGRTSDPATFRRRR